MSINFLQSLGAILGFFIGVAVSANSLAASNWILAVTAGLFFYIALTDLVRISFITCAVDYSI